MIALAAALAVYGYYQVFVGLPAARAEYAANPDEALKDVGQWAPAGSAERLRFERRLASDEPMATFALTNSLAALLAPWLLVAMGIAWGQMAALRRGARTRRGCGAAARCAAGRDDRHHRRLLRAHQEPGGLRSIGSGGRGVALRDGRGPALVELEARGGRGACAGRRAGAAAALGGFNGELLGMAGKSFAYRWEYWQSTMAMIGRYPWLGVGPGNFQDYYTQFKLPEASEEVRDPHNFLLEIWATCGTFAFVALVEVLALFGWRTWLGPAAPLDGAPDAKGSKPSDAAAPAHANRQAEFMLTGAALGVGLAFVIGPSVGLPFSGELAVVVLAAGGAVVAVLWPWIVGGGLAPRLPALALAVLAIDLLATGGIAIPGVACTFWMLMALGVNELAGNKRRRPLRPTPGGSGSCRRSGWRRLAWRRPPVTAMPSGRSCRRGPRCCGPTRRGRVRGARRAYLEAARADPLSADAWTALAELELGALRSDRLPGTALSEFVTAAEKVTELRPHSAATWGQVGRWYIELYERNHNQQTASAAVENFKNAVELYPNSATMRGEYSLALAAAGESAACAPAGETRGGARWRHAARRQKNSRQNSRRRRSAGRRGRLGRWTDVPRQAARVDRLARGDLELIERAGASVRPIERGGFLEVVSGRYARRVPLLACLAVLIAVICPAGRASRGTQIRVNTFLARRGEAEMKASHVAIAGILAGVALGGGMSFARFSHSPPLRLESTVAHQVGNQPAVKVDHADWDFGVVERDTELRHAFPVTNVGGSTLTLADAGTTCTKCTIARLDKSEVAPGETVNVTIVYRTTYLQPNFQQTAFLRTNDPQRPRIELRISGIVTSRYQVVPDGFQLNKVSGSEPHSASIIVYSYIAKKIDVVGYEFTGADSASLFEVTSHPVAHEDLAEPQLEGGVQGGFDDETGLALGPDSSDNSPHPGHGG